MKHGLSCFLGYSKGEGYCQVDQNVSRHLADELSKDDWNLLILHYLGLDHVGHIGGWSSVLMAPKLKEMDEVVKLIHSSIKQSQGNRQGRTLLMIVSDHGMTENGNHGGSTYEETDSLALFIGLRNHVFDYASVINQIDIAPTLALLFGVPIPKNNVGVLIREAFDSLKEISPVMHFMIIRVQIRVSAIILQRTCFVACIWKRQLYTPPGSLRGALSLLATKITAALQQHITSFSNLQVSGYREELLINLLIYLHLDWRHCLSQVFLLLISGRILRGWHQGGVNWTSLPDISKWLEHAGSRYVKPLQLMSAVLVISIGLFALFSIESRGKCLQMVRLGFLISGLLVLLHITRYQDYAFSSTNYGATFLVQITYAILGAVTIGTVVALPWLIPLSTSKIFPADNTFSPPFSPSIQEKFPLVELRDTLYVVGWAYILCWCLLQLLLQQPINTTPILLLLLQIVAGVHYFVRSGTQEWVEIAGFYCLGMAGHFALGNSNTLATIDVAGAFIGISNHSTFLSGILMFIITYASPMFILLSLVMYISTKSMVHLVIPEKANAGDILMMLLGFPCPVPLVLNSILLTAYTVVLLFMQNHLFVWSVFSPKYLYVCATTVCTLIGVFIVAATGFYTYFVLAMRKEKACSGQQRHKIVDST
ncbi:hypothetical protein V6N13_043555 [Hibiscus sabdariffa]